MEEKDEANGIGEKNTEEKPRLNSKRAENRLLLFPFFPPSCFETFQAALIFSMLSSHFTIFFSASWHRDSPYQGLTLMISFYTIGLVNGTRVDIAGAQFP